MGCTISTDLDIPRSSTDSTSTTMSGEFLEFCFARYPQLVKRRFASGTDVAARDDGDTMDSLSPIVIVVTPPQSEPTSLQDTPRCTQPIGQLELPTRRSSTSGLVNELSQTIS